MIRMFTGMPKDDVEHRHEQNGFLQKQSLHQDLQGKEQCQVGHGDGRQECLLHQAEIENVISQSE